MSQALQIRPSGSPASFRSSFGDDDVTRSIAHRPKKPLEYGSTSQPGAIPIPGRNDRLGTSPRLEPIRLAPDSQGKEIPPDAKWTRISRHLVSPEVVAHDGRRYEA